MGSVAKPHAAVSKAFTLLEILLVMALLAILLSMHAGLHHSIREHTRHTRARAEIAILVAALERYRVHHGDYPLLTDPLRGYSVLFQALSEGARNSGLSKFRGLRVGKQNRNGVWEIIQEDLALNSPGDAKAFLDPWEMPYHYLYHTVSASEWLNPSFIIISEGSHINRSKPTLPDGFTELSRTGYFPDSLPAESPGWIIHPEVAR